MGLTGKTAPYKAGFGPFPAEIHHAPFPIAYHGVSVSDSIAGLERLFAEDIEPARVAAIIVEPVQGEGGFYIAPPEFLQALRALCDQHGIVLIADEIQTGFGRTGKMFAMEHSGVEPDLMTVAKSLAGGFPLAGVVGKAQIMDAPAPGGLGGTYAASPIGCTAGLAVLEAMEKEQSAGTGEPNRQSHHRPAAQAGRPVRLLVIGGGLAGLAAAVVLAERGVHVTVLERESFLGGRAGAWTDRLRDGTTFEMERGFHAFFRQYYNLRQLLRRVAPELGFLKPTADYPILTPTGNESFAGLTHAPLVNVAKLTWRTETLGIRDLMKVNVPAALAMLRFDRPRTYAEFDERTAGAYLDSLNFPPLARQRLLHVFAHSCFNPQADMSAAELLQMLHFYFTANYDGLVFDVTSRPFSRCIFQPLGALLGRLGARVRTGIGAQALVRRDGDWVVETDGEALQAHLVVLATEVTGIGRSSVHPPASATRTGGAASTRCA